jgi:hypothetical protein
MRPYTPAAIVANAIIGHIYASISLFEVKRTEMIMRDDPESLSEAL